ncbi:MAG TPA: PDDEXK nuclease domain-containing protein [Paludibacter sp.]|nr:PDDEXK nuclease domain-containing protein [Paludibacter sp.]
MNFSDLAIQIQQTSEAMQQSAMLAVNSHLTIRNWLIGFYIVEFEQKGEDRAKYGEKLLQRLTDYLSENNFSLTNLKLYRQFYFIYPQISEVIPDFFQMHANDLLTLLDKHLLVTEIERIAIGQSLTDQLQFVNPLISQSVNDQLEKQKNSIHIPTQKLIAKLSFTHFVQLLPIDDPIKRQFYEMECIKGTWSVRELNRQIKTLYYERLGLSKQPEKLSSEVQGKSEKNNWLETIKSPFTFEFLGLKSKDVVYESDVEQALIEHLQDFILELGHGFCFEARQKRILIGNKYYFCDLVFYHRILKCHVLIDLKMDEFSHEHFGQLKTYVNYYKKEIMCPDDNPPVGILLVTDKDHALVEYATADSDKDIFVSKYLLELPSKEKLIDFIKTEISKL